MAVLEPEQLEQSPLADLHAIASALGIEGFRRLRKAELIEAIVAGSGSGSGSGSGGGTGDAPAAPKPRGRRDRRPALTEGEAAEQGDAPEPTATERPEAEAEDRPRRPRRRRGRGRGRDEDGTGSEAAPASEGDDAASEDEEAPAREEESTEPRTGVLDMLGNGSGFLRADPFRQADDDVYVSQAQIRRCELRGGDEVTGPVRAARRSERHPSLVRVDTINGAPADPLPERSRFEDLTPVWPNERLPSPAGLESVPFGRGSRISLSGPPGSGVTEVFRRVVDVLIQTEGVEVTVVLAGTRPEEVTDWRRSVSIPVAGGGIDRPADEQAQAAEMALERAKRIVERGGHAALAVDTPDALPDPLARRLFGAARRTEEGGSLTVVAMTSGDGELDRVATTHIVLRSAAEAEGTDPAPLAQASGTTRGDLLAG